MLRTKCLSRLDGFQTDPLPEQGALDPKTDLIAVRGIEALAASQGKSVSPPVTSP